MPPSLFTFDELVLGKDGQLKKEKRFPGTNKVGMLAWHTVLKTPQYPEGREVVMIANDVTVQSGSFGVQEDDFFFAASVYARERGIPRVFISCNSGARIGLVDELKPKFKVAWKEESNPSLGFDYLYLTEEDYHALPKGTVDAVSVVDKRSGEIRWQLEAIIGQTHGIGVENLRYCPVPSLTPHDLAAFFILSISFFSSDRIIRSSLASKISINMSEVRVCSKCCYSSVEGRIHFSLPSP